MKRMAMGAIEGFENVPSFHLIISEYLHLNLVHRIWLWWNEQSKLTQHILQQIILINNVATWAYLSLLAFLQLYLHDICFTKQKKYFSK